MTFGCFNVLGGGGMIEKDQATELNDNLGPLCLWQFVILHTKHDFDDN